MLFQINDSILEALYVEKNDQVITKILCKYLQRSKQKILMIPSNIKKSEEKHCLTNEGEKENCSICVPSKEGPQSSALLVSHPLWAKNTFVYSFVSSIKNSYIKYLGKWTLVRWAKDDLYSDATLF